MIDIDYQELAQAAWESTTKVSPIRDGLIPGYTAIALAVVAALRDQGLCVADLGDMAHALGWAACVQSDRPLSADESAAADRIGAILGDEWARQDEITAALEISA